MRAEIAERDSMVTCLGQIVVVFVIVVVVGKSASTRFRKCKNGCHGIYLINLTGGASEQISENAVDEETSSFAKVPNCDEVSISLSSPCPKANQSKM